MNTPFDPARAEDAAGAPADPWSGSTDFMTDPGFGYALALGSHLGSMACSWPRWHGVAGVTLRPSCGRGVIFAMHNYLRAPVAQPDRAAAF